MNEPQTSQQTIEEICDRLRHKVLEPSKEEAEKLIADAEIRAAEILEKAQKQAEEMIAAAKEKIEEEKILCSSSLAQAGRQAIESLKQAIQNKLFQPQLEDAVHEEMKKPKIICDIIKALVHAIEKEGVHMDLAAFIPTTASPQEINALLLDHVLKKLKGESVVIGDFAGGAAIRVEDKSLFLDMTEKSLRELLEKYLHKDFRKWLFIES